MKNLRAAQVAALAVALGVEMPFNSTPREPKIITAKDRERLAAAEQLRLKRRAKRLRNST